MADLSFLPEWLQHLLGAGAAGGGAAGAFKMLERLFTVKPNDIPTCTTRVMRAGRGWPWSKQIGVHPLKDGRIEIKLLDI
jgi:hypothetical protein